MERQSLATANVETIQELIKKISDEVNNSGIPGISFSLRNFVQHNAQENQRGVKLALSGTASNKFSSQIKTLKENVQKLMENYTEDSLVFRVSTSYGVGEKFPLVENLLTIGTKENKSFSCPSGEVVLVDFWATWCGPCQKPMAHNQEMLEKNHEIWAGKARIVAISLDEEYEAVEERITSKKWDKIENYQSVGGWENGAGSQFGIRGIPTVMLVDKNSYIRFRGHPSEVNLEDKINELINEADGAYNPEEKPKEVEKKNEEGEENNNEQSQKKLTLEEEIQFFKQFEESFESLKDLLVNEKRYYLGIDSTRNILPKPDHQAEVYLDGETTEEGKPHFIEIYRKIFKTLPESLSKYAQMRIPKKHSVKYGSSCATCKKEVGKSIPHYVCTTCQCEGKEDHAFCVDCANKEMNEVIELPSQLFHPHGLVYLNEKNESQLENIRRLYNISEMTKDDDPQLNAIKESKNIGGYFCDDCGEKIKNYRWGCAQCPDFDYCDKCFQISINPEHEKHADQLERMKNKGHDENHFCYRQHFFNFLRALPPQTINFAEETKEVTVTA